MVDYLGRKGVQTVSFFVGAVSFAALLGFKSGILLTVIIFIGRASVLSALTALFILTPELYETRIRTRAFGIANSLSRVGGMVAPFVGQGLVGQGRINDAIYILGGMTLLAALSSMFMGAETAG